MAASDIVTLADVKSHLNITDSFSDTELARFVSAATKPVEQKVGAVIQRPVTERFDGGQAVIALSETPVSSVTSITENGVTLDPSGYSVTAAGILTRVAGLAPLAFLVGFQNVVVTYVPGVAATTAEVDGNVSLAALIIIQHMWETQRPAAAGPFSQAQDDYDPRYSYSIPRRALELLGAPVGGIA